MGEQLNDPEDALLDRAIAALRNTPAGDGPSPRLEAATIAALRAAGEEPSALRIRPRHGRTWIAARIAAVLVLGICAAAIYVVMRHSAPPIVQNTRPAPADIQPANHPTNPQLTHQLEAPKSNEQPAPDHKHLLAQDPTPAPQLPDATPPGLVRLAIAGHVTLKGTPPVMHPIDFTPVAVCAKHHHGQPVYDDSVIAGEGGQLANVVISVSSGLPSSEDFPAPQEPVTLDQKQCMYTPHVVAAMVGQPVVVRNSDDLLHNVHAMAVQNPTFNFGQPTRGAMNLEPFREMETFQVKCDLHPWMNAWVRVFNHPYFAITGKDGSYSLPPLPPGRYKVKAWHEVYQIQEREITIEAGKPAFLDFTYHAAN